MHVVVVTAVVAVVATYTAAIFSAFAYMAVGLSAWGGNSVNKGPNFS